MRFLCLRKFAARAILLGLALCQAESVFGSAYKVTPIQVVLSGKTSSALLTLTNESPDTLRFQISAFAWNQSPRGEMELAPTEEVIFFPALLSLSPREERKVRVGATVAPGARQKTYRIFFEELPPLVKAEQAEAGSQVRLLTKMGIPIFLNPSSPVVQGVVQDLVFQKRRLSFAAKNGGNVHFMVQRVRVTGSGPGGEKTFERDLAGWYILAGGTREFETQISNEDCEKTKSIAVSVQTERKAFHQSVAVPSGACATPE